MNKVYTYTYYAFFLPDSSFSFFPFVPVSAVPVARYSPPITCTWLRLLAGTPTEIKYRFQELSEIYLFRIDQHQIAT